MRRASALAGLLLLAAGAAAAQAPAQAPGEAPAPASGEAVRVEAGDGMEWRRDERVIVARGRARASQGDLSVEADTLVARYRDGPDGAFDIHRLDALGAVVIRAPEAEATGDEAVYDVDRSLLVLRGENLRIVSDGETITARDSFEYYRDERYAVARGEAVLVRGNATVAADVIVGRFEPDGEGGLALDRLEAHGKVEVRTGSEIVRGQRGVYTIDSRRAGICGDVRITRGKNQLNGDCAQVDLASGISRVLSGEGGRVRGLLRPDGDIAPERTDSE